MRSEAGENTHSTGLGQNVGVRSCRIGPGTSRSDPRVTRGRRSRPYIPSAQFKNHTITHTFHYQFTATEQSLETFEQTDLESERVSQSRAIRWELSDLIFYFDVRFQENDDKKPTFKTLHRTSSLYNCTTQLYDCTTQLYNCTTQLYNCTTQLYNCTTQLYNCTTQLYDCTTQLYNCTTQLYDCTTQLYDCTTQLYNCTTQLYNCTTQLYNCTTQLYNCTTQLYNCTTQLYNCSITALHSSITAL
ncbi:unnamed protein product [Leuciscus chuanchicus]